MVFFGYILMSLLLLAGWPGLAAAEINYNFVDTIEDQTTNDTNGSEVDVIVETSNYKPSFYRGRAEPSSGNSVRLIAVPNIAGDSAETEYDFLWNVAGTRIRPASPSRVSVINLTAPYTDNMLVELTIIDQFGNLVAEHREYIPLTESEIVFYEDNLLRGLSQIAIGSSYTLVGSEATIRAEPYFMGSIKTDDLRSNWSINDTEVQTADDWRSITLGQLNGIDSYEVGFSVYHQQNVTEEASNEFILNLGL